MLEPPYETKRERDARQRDDACDAADDDERLEREAEREPGGEELREAVTSKERDLEAAQDEDHVEEQQPGDADQPELLRERRVDEVGVQVRDDLLAARGREDPVAEAVPPSRRGAIEYRDCTCW